MTAVFPVTVDSPLGADAFVFRSLKGTEALGRPFEMQLELYSTTQAITLNDLVGQNVTVTAAFPSGRTRYFNGDVAEMRQLTGMHTDKYIYALALRPKLWFLQYKYDCRIFQNRTVTEIITAVLDEHGLTDRTLSLTGTYTAREYCVQYNESDLDFISRLMEEEGIYYFFTHESGKHTLVLADALSAHAAIAGKAGDGKIVYRPPRVNYSEDHVDDWTISQQVQTSIYAHTAFNFETPRTNLLAQSEITQTYGHAGKKAYRYPGRHKVVADGTSAAKLRIEELQVGWERIEGRTNSDEFAAGKLFTLAEYDLRDDQNREHLLVRASYDLDMETDLAAGDTGPAEGGLPGVTFVCRFEAIDSQRPYRPPAVTPRPRIAGPQTAFVVGKAGEEIWTDQYGRVKVQFHWDQVGAKDENSSCWLRVAQLWASKSFGAIQIPRIGDEVIVDFLEGDPDQPIIVGRVYNADNPVPYALPTNQTQSGILTRSSKGGSATTANELRFEDKKDAEQIYFQAEKNFDRVVKNNDTLKVGFEKKDAGDQTIDIYNHRTVTLDQGNDKLQVKTGNREILIDKGNDKLQVKEGNRETLIDKGNLTVTVGQGNYTLKVSQAKGLIEAATELTLKVGNSTIVIKPDSITLTSVNIKAEASGNLEVKGTQSKVAGSASLDLDGGTITLN